MLLSTGSLDSSAQSSLFPDIIYDCIYSTSSDMCPTVLHVRSQNSCFSVHGKYSNMHTMASSYDVDRAFMKNFSWTQLGQDYVGSAHTVHI